MTRGLRAALFFALLLAAWQAAVSFGHSSRLLLPAPADVGRYLVRAAGDGSLLDASLVTGRRLLVGYLVGLVLGLPLGMLTARFKVFSDTLGMLALGMQTLPSVCWVPLALLWFGQTETAVLFVVIMGTMWSILIATDSGIRTIPVLYARAARTMGSRRFHTLLFVTFPASLPVVITGMKQGWAFAWRSLMAAEIYVTIITGFGLGHLLHYGRELHAMDQVLGVMLVIIAVGLLADRLIFWPAQRYLHRRWGLEV